MRLYHRQAGLVVALLGTACVEDAANSGESQGTSASATDFTTSGASDGTESSGDGGDEDTTDADGSDGGDDDQGNSSDETGTSDGDTSGSGGEESTGETGPATVCGDDVIEEPELCDDGNLVDDDDCDADCMPTAVAAVDTGNNHSCALLRSGSVRCWGQGADGQLGHGNTEG